MAGMHPKLGVPGFVTRDLVALHIKIGEVGDQKEVAVSPAYKFWEIIAIILESFEEMTRKF